MMVIIHPLSDKNYDGHMRLTGIIKDDHHIHDLMSPSLDSIFKNESINGHDEAENGEIDK